MYTTNLLQDLEPRSLRILVIDDSRTSLKLIAEYLGALHFAVSGAPSGKLGLARARREQPALILLDVMMDGLDGYETCECLKRDPTTRDIPVIFMTALHDPEHKVRGFEAGAVDYVTKPVNCEELLARISIHLRIYTLTRRQERLVEERTSALQETNLALREVIAQHEQTARELIAAREAAERASAAKSRFLTNMNHELRTPLQGIIGGASLLMDEDREPDRALIKTIADAGAMMLALINNVLDFSKLEFDRVALNVAATDIRSCVASAMDMIAVEATRKQLSLSADIDAGVPEMLILDELRCQQILVNLLGNAVKFTDAGQVAVRVRVGLPDRDVIVPDDACELRISVVDSGIGIPEEHVPELFQMFHQVDASSTRRQRGTGIGLALSKKLVELMGGRIWVESCPGEGSAFHVAIPTRASTRPSLIPERQPLNGTDRHGDAAAERPRLRILLADDNPINRRVALSMLDRTGYQADSVANGREVLNQLQRGTYDVILMDIQMPEMDGVAATRHIRERLTADAQPYIIALTANTMRSDREHYLRSGIDAFLGKPFQIDELAAVLAQAASRKQTGDRGDRDDTRGYSGSIRH